MNENIDFSKLGKIDHAEQAIKARESLIKSKNEVKKNGYIEKKISLLGNTNKDFESFNIFDLLDEDLLFIDMSGIKDNIQEEEFENEAVKRLLGKKGVSDKELLDIIKEVDEFLKGIQDDELDEEDYNY